MSTNFMTAEFQALTSAPASERKRRFLEYCHHAIESKDSGKASLQEAAYAIAGTMFIKEISEDPELEAITVLAGELELPPEHVSDEPGKLWQELIEMVNTAGLS